MNRSKLFIVCFFISLFVFKISIIYASEAGTGSHHALQKNAIEKKTVFSIAESSQSAMSIIPPPTNTGRLLVNAPPTATFVANNNAPIADFSVTPNSGSLPLTIKLDASASFDKDGSIMIYSWSSTDGKTANGKVISMTFNKMGTFFITLRVTDDKGATVSKVASINVMADQINQQPVADFSLTPDKGIVPLQVNLDASSSNDPDGTITTYLWSISNGQSFVGKTTILVLNQPGTFIVSLTVKDNKNATASISKSIVVKNKSNPVLGYNDTARIRPQVIMSGVSPSIIDTDETSFDVLALVRPGILPLQNVVLEEGGNPLFGADLEHINTLKNGDQLWKATINFDRGTFGVQDFLIKWGIGRDQFSIRATDSNQQTIDDNRFPTVIFDAAPEQLTITDQVIDDNLNYQATKRTVPQIIMAGVSPAIIDIMDTSFDVVAIIRPGVSPIQNVFLKQIGSKLFNIGMTKKTNLNNGDEIWAATFKFPQRHYSMQTFPLVWGTDNNEFNIQVIDASRKMYITYPTLKFGDFPAK